MIGEKLSPLDFDQEEHEIRRPNKDRRVKMNSKNLYFYFSADWRRCADRLFCSDGDRDRNLVVCPISKDEKASAVQEFSAVRGNQQPQN